MRCIRIAGGFVCLPRRRRAPASRAPARQLELFSESDRCRCGHVRRSHRAYLMADDATTLDAECIVCERQERRCEGFNLASDGRIQ